MITSKITHSNRLHLSSSSSSSSSFRTITTISPKATFLLLLIIILSTSVVATKNNGRHINFDITDIIKNIINNNNHNDKLFKSRYWDSQYSLAFVNNQYSKHSYSKHEESKGDKKYKKNKKKVSLSKTHSKKYQQQYKQSKAKKSTITQGEYLQNLKNKKEKTVVILYYKPKNVITSHSNSDAVSQKEDNHSHDNHDKRRTVYDDIMSMKGYLGSNDSTHALTFEQVTGIQSKLHAIGRLDVDTTGLLLVTNDGGLVHHVTNPTASTKHKSSSEGCNDSMNNNNNQIISKTYQAVIMGHHTLPSMPTNTKDIIDNLETYDLKQYKLLQLYHGIDIGAKYGGMTKPVDDIQILNHPTKKSTLVSITISEGKNRQIRRMFHAIGSGVMSLHRVNVGRINLNMLSANGNMNGKEGCWRMLSDEEILDGLGWNVRIW